VAYQAEVEIVPGLDTASSLGNLTKKLSGKVPQDDPVIFDPSIPSSSASVDLDNLGGRDLKSLNMVLTTTSLSDTAQGTRPIPMNFAGADQVEEYAQQPRDA
jgi:hypothetical protein